MAVSNRQKRIGVGKIIPVTRPFMPPVNEYEKYLNGIWQREYVTNNGPLVQELEQKLQHYLGVENLLYVSNGTVALQLAIRALGLSGEVITTPFSFVATSSAIVWEHCTPVFVDVDPESFNINPDLIEEAITDQTSAILATHVFGNPCDTERIRKIADRFDLHVIYDAAHGFGTRYRGSSIFNQGDITATSFHATKLFHTVEGGALITKDSGLLERLNYMRNFGHDGPGKFNGVGINGKNSELHAAMGLCNLSYIDSILAERERQCRFYDHLLKGLPLTRQVIRPETVFNYSYYPVLFRDETTLLQVTGCLEEAGIFPRRYFYPSLDKLDYVESYWMEVSSNLSRRVLCLPLYHDLTQYDQVSIATIIKDQLTRSYEEALDIRLKSLSGI